MTRLRTAPHVPVLSAVLAVAGLAVSAAAMMAEPVQPAPTQPPAQGPAAKPVPANGPISPRATKTMILLVKFKGMAQIRRPENIDPDPKKGWEPARAGIGLPEGTQIRTGPNSEVVLQIGATQTITVDKLTSTTVRLAVNDAGTERTRLDLEQGRLGIDVDSTRIANDVQVQTPQTTLAVTGTTLFIEHTSAFGTTAWGAKTNTGSFVVLYANGAVATVTGDQGTSEQTPDPAQAEQESAQVDTADPKAREHDEQQVAQRAAGSGDALGLGLGISPSATDLVARPSSDNPPAAIATYLAFDQGTGTVYETDLSGDRRKTIVEGLLPAPGAPFSGMSVIERPDGGRTLYLLRSDVIETGATVTARNRLFSLNLQNPITGFDFGLELGGGGKALLMGLGSLDSRLFAHGFDLGRTGPVDSVYEVFPTDGSIRTAMAIPGVAIGGAGGSNERGSIFLAGRLDLADGSDQHVFLEVDPRTNYFIGASGGSEMDLMPTAGTVVSAGLDPSSIDNISGLAVVDGILVMSATAMVGGKETSVVLQYDPAAAGTPSSPRLRRVEAVSDASFIRDLASERGLTGRPSRKLDDSPGRIDLAINRTFAEMAYGEEALSNSILERLVGNEIINTARDPAGCAASGALDVLPSILQRHVNQTSGIGRSVAEFRESLPFLHPCRAD